MRCLVLADELRRRGHECQFYCRPLENNGIRIVRARGFQCSEMSSPEMSEEEDANALSSSFVKAGQPDWVVLDHYGLARPWQRKIREGRTSLMVIDDLVDRNIDADLILNQNPLEHLFHRYDELAPKYCEMLLGLEYALIGPAFRGAREKGLRVRHSVGNLLLFLGGADDDNDTLRILTALKEQTVDLVRVDVVCGAANRHAPAVERFCAEWPLARYFYQTEIMAQLTYECDLAIGAGGSSNWERCCLGLPCITIETAPNQHDSTAALALAGAIVNLGRAECVNAVEIVVELRRLQEDPGRLGLMSAAAYSLVDGSGSVRVADALEKREQQWVRT